MIRLPTFTPLPTRKPRLKRLQDRDRPLLHFLNRYACGCFQPLTAACVWDALKERRWAALRRCSKCRTPAEKAEALRMRDYIEPRPNGRPPVTIT